MTLGQKIKEIRKRFNLSQEQLAETLNVSRQAITKWESDVGIPDVENLQELSKRFGVTVDYLLSDSNEMPILIMKKEIDKVKYKNKLTAYFNILKDEFSKEYEVYTLIREKNMTKLESVLDLLSYGIHSDLDDVGDMSPYYLVKKEYRKYLVNIKNWVMSMQELPAGVNEQEFVVGQNKFINTGRLELK